MVILIFFMATRGVPGRRVVPEGRDPFEAGRGRTRQAQ